jgi:adenine-specific DNA-methyltransferase
MEVSVATVSENTAQNTTTAEPEKLDLRSHDIAEDKKAELLQLFPEIRTGGGKIDFDKLKLALGETVDVGRERYGMNWPGKADCFKTIQQPSLGTLLPRREESINFDAAENLIIEGDNLEVLKLLQKSYHDKDKVRMIYIDPPYNTGNDFIYPDNYSESLQTYLEYTGQVDGEGRKFSTNTDTDGRFHSKWLNMMYPRLYLARNLLRDDGAIFISIDDGELANLKMLVSEIFGEENLVATFSWEKRTTRENRRVFSFNHEYVVCAARNKVAFEESRNLLPLTDEVIDRYDNPDNDPRGKWQSVSLNAQAGHATKDQFYVLTTPSGRTLEAPPGRCWSVTKKKLEELIADNRVWFGANGDNVPRRKVFITEAREGLTPHTLWTAGEVGTNDSAKKDLMDLFDGTEVFETPKPVGLVKRMLEIATDKGDLVLDFFAGSGVTAQAVLDLNRADGGSRRFVLVQLPEPVQKDRYSTIADITRDRVRRVIQRLEKEAEQSLPLNGESNFVLGFKAFTLRGSNFKVWASGGADANRDAASFSSQLDLHIDHIVEGRTAEDILSEILLKSGFPLSTKVDVITLISKTVFSIAGGAMLICLDRSLNHEVIKAMADMRPERVVCLDEGFVGNDQLKTNAVQTMKARGVTSFLTV